MSKNSLIKRAKEQKLDLVGVNLISKYIDPAMIEDPILEIEPGDKDLYILNIRPIGQQVAELKQFVKDLEANKAGKNVGRPIEEEKAPEGYALALASLHYDPFKVGIYFDKEVEEESFMLEKVQYYKLTLATMLPDFSVLLTLLFKEHTSDSVTFFSDLINKKLSKRSTKRILTELCDGNVTGVPITAIVYQDTSHSATLYPITNTILAKEDPDTYTFVSTTGSITINKSEIKNAVISKTKNKDYFIKINMHGLFRIQLHV